MRMTIYTAMMFVLAIVILAVVVALLSGGGDVIKGLLSAIARGLGGI